VIKLLRTYCLLLACLSSFAVFAQSPDAVIDRNEILTGEQAVLKLSYPVNKSNPAKVQFPNIGDTLVDKVEVVRKSEIDTLTTGEGVSTIRLEQTLHITSFDTGFYAIKPFEFIINGQSEMTPAFLLTVKTVEIDTTAGIMGDRGIYTVDVSFMDYVKVYWKYPVIVLGAAALIAVLVLLILKYNEKRKARPQAPPPPPARPAHEVALEALSKTREEKIYKRGKIKEYHTAITDALRDYLEGDYRIPAHELTTRQIISALKYSGVDEKEMIKLRTILFRADMVKFAKETPDEQENTAAVNDAIQFVQNTLPSPQPTEKPEPDA